MHKWGTKIEEFGHKIDELAPKIEKAGEQVQTVLDEMNGLPKDAPAQFAAGVLYGASNGTIDERDYILGCTWSNPILRRHLNKAFKNYNAGKDQKGNKQMQKAEPWFSASMITCWKTAKYFRRIDDAMDKFFAREDWNTVVQDNYSANQDYIDQQWGYTLKTWNEGVYFNAGMFYAQTFAALAASEEIDASLLDF